MKALTVKQPWVHAILHEGKDIENRSWQCSFRDWLALHAGAQMSIALGEAQRRPESSAPPSGPALNGRQNLPCAAVARRGHEPGLRP